MTLDELKTEKTKLISDIIDLMFEFHGKTGVYVDECIVDVKSVYTVDIENKGMRKLMYKNYEIDIRLDIA